MQKIRGCRGARKVSAAGAVDVQNVTVMEDESGVLLALSTSSFPALLTAEEARHVAACLLLAAKNLEGAVHG